MASFEEHLKRVASEFSDIELTEEVKRTVMASCDVRGILVSWGFSRFSSTERNGEDTVQITLFTTVIHSIFQSGS